MDKNIKAQSLPDAESLKIDRGNYYKQALQGYYQFDCVVSEAKVRSAKFYIPANSIYNQPTVFILIPGQTDAYEFLVTSGWKKMSDEKGIYIVLLEPDEEGLWQGDEIEEVYINALREDVSYRPLFCAFSPNFYAVAYGEAADLLGRQSRKNPKAWAAVALIGATGMEEQEKQSLETTDSKVSEVLLSQVQMPVWVVPGERNEKIERLLDYYKNANHSGAEPHLLEEVQLFAPLPGGTVDEHWCAKVVYQTGEWSRCLGYEYSQRIYEEVFKGIYRYPGNGNGALRHHNDINQRGFQKFSEKVAGGYREDGGDTYQRVWWVYVPETVDKTKLSPAVFVFHGAGGSGDEIADRSGWAEVADKKGLILICPSASNPNRVRNVSGIRTNEMFRSMWNTGDAQEERPADILFLDYLYKWLTDKYPVDPSRIYASGQSSGGMMTWACAAYRPDYFAAVAPVSAKVISMESETYNPPVKRSLVPIMANLGLEDQMFAGGFGTEDAKELIDLWCNRYHLTKSWDSYTYNHSGETYSFKDGVFTNFIFQTQEGVPLLRCVEADTKHHAIWPSECEMIWDQWMSKFSKNPETKELYYKGNETIVR